MTATPTQTADARALRDLLLVVTRDPRQHLAAIRVAREAAGANAAARRELDREELRFLSAEAERTGGTGGARAELDAALAAARDAALRHALRSLLATDPADPVALFDLAELAATCAVRGRRAEADEVGAAVRARAATIAVDQRLLETARERCSALATEEQDLELAHRVAWLRETSALLRTLARRGRSRTLRRLAGRLAREAQDRELARRVERVLGRRGAWLLENLSLGLLLVLSVLLAVELLVPLAESTLRTLLIVDGVICVLFALEFAFKLALVPRRPLWFARHALIDLLPSLPAVLLLLHVAVPPEAADVALVRVLRFLRIAYFARFVQPLLPIVRLARFCLLLVRGLDGLVERFAPQLNRDFVFFERAPLLRANAPDRATPATPQLRSLVFAALRREHVLLADLPREQRATELTRRARDLAARLEASPADPAQPSDATPSAREVPVEDLIERLHALRPEELSLWLPRADLLALDRMVRVLSAPLVRSLPLVRRVALRPLPATPEARVAGFGQRIADWVDRWRERTLYVADLHGILTGPQVLDRLASAMINASQRPAVRLLFFGALFLLVRTLIGAESGPGQFLQRFVATPLLVFGAVCMVFLMLGRWFKRIAGEATEMLKRTSEAQFISLLELQKARHREQDLAFLARRIFRGEEAGAIDAALARIVRQLQHGVLEPGEPPPAHLRQDLNRAALLYLHFLDGAILHESDVKTTEQLFANLSLENIRRGHLAWTRRDRRRLRKLKLERGSLFGGPYLWFRFITESVALETAKRVIDYNRNCLPLAQRREGSHPLAGVRAERMRAWLEKRAGERSGRTLERARGTGPGYVTTEFNALDFLTTDPERDEHVLRTFGPEVLATLRTDRRAMMREIFGTRPLDRLPRSRRTLNVHRFYRRRLSGGRALLLPLVFAFGSLRLVLTLIQRTTGIVREILNPELAQRRVVSGVAPFAVALRKIHRMKAPGLLEAMRMRVVFDPDYAGIPATWSGERTFDPDPELERDLDFLRVPERDRGELRALAERNHARARRWHALVRELPGFSGLAAAERRHAERAATIAYLTDFAQTRTLLHGEEWWHEFAAAAPGPARRLRAVWQWLCRGGAPHPVDRWLERAGLSAPPRLRASLRRAWRGGGAARALIDAWSALPPGTSPREWALAILRDVWCDHGTVSRELHALRAVQSLSVLDVRNYREVVFRVGDYAADGEDPALATALP